MQGVTVVTGGAGFIGQHLVHALQRRGHAIRVLERPGAALDHLDEGLEVAVADIRDRQAVRKGLKDAGWVFHLAANPNLWVRDRREFDAVNHQGTVHVLEEAIAAGASRILHCSTESILTCARATGPIAEDVEITEADAVGPYCLSKLRAEQFARKLAEAGHPVFIGNPSMPVGPGDRGLSPPTRLILDFANGRLPAIMDCTLNLVDVRDVAEGLVRVLEVGKPGRRYLLAGENLTLLQILRQLSVWTGQPVPRFRIPYPVALGFAHLSELWADLRTGRSPQATVTGVRLTQRTMHFDARRTWEDLDRNPGPVAAALHDSVRWLIDQQLLPRNLGLEDAVENQPALQRGRQ